MPPKIEGLPSRGKKKEYNFDIKKKYRFEKGFSVVEKSVLDQLKELVHSFTKKEGEKDEKKKEAQEKRLKEKLESFKPVLIKAGIAFALLLAVFAGLLIFSTGSIEPPIYRQDTAIYQKTLADQLFITDAQTASFSSEQGKKLVTMFRLVYLGNNSTVNITVETFPYPLYSHLYVYIGESTQSEKLPELYDQLAEQLEPVGITVSKVSLAQVREIPPGSMLLLPSGMLPEEFVENNAELLALLMKKKVHVIYIGKKWDRYLKKGGTTEALSESQEKAIGLAYGVPSQANQLSMKNPTYTAQKKGVLFSASNIIYGSVSVLYGKEGGVVLIMPQVIDIGWGSMKELGSDIKRIVTELRWIEEKNSKSFLLYNSTDMFMVSAPYSSSGASLRVVAFNEKNETLVLSTFTEKDFPGYVEFGGFTSYHITEKISGAQITGTAILNGQSSAKKKIFYSVLENGSLEVDRSQIGTQLFDVSGAEPLFSIGAKLDPGYYIVSIQDEDGIEYARGALIIEDIIPYITRVNFENATFEIRFVNPRYEPVVADSVKITVRNQKGEKIKEASYFGVSRVSLALNEYAQEGKLPSENYNFAFKFGQVEKKLAYSPPISKPFWAGMEWLYVPLTLVLIVSILMFFLLRRAEPIVYILDIPDFPPVSKKNIKMKVDDFAELFEELNRYYKWKYTPLSLEEIKFGFTRRTYEGKKIVLSDYNLKYVLDKVISSGKVQKALDLYVLSKWAKESGRNALYLALFRKIRDICLNYVIPFTPMNSEKDFDTKLTIIGQEFYLHLYDKDFKRIINNVLNNITAGINVIVFADTADKEDFKASLNAESYSMKILKNEINGESVLLLTIDELDSFVKEMKII
ncbi:MAG: hypothetical protein QW035_04575 [Candidatus Anstonellales archaeon]